jgi:hypothetical protein
MWNVWKNIISDGHDNNKNEKEFQQQEDLEASNIIVEKIDGTYYTFYTANCALMFKKFNAVYGSNFADE